MATLGSLSVGDFFRFAGSRRVYSRTAQGYEAEGRILAAWSGTKIIRM